MTPAAVAELVHHGHEVIVETAAGLGSGLPDEEYVRAGGEDRRDRAQRSSLRAEMIVKVKEPLAEERKRLEAGRSCSPTCISRPISSRRATSWPRGATCIAYETVTSPTAACRC